MTDEPLTKHASNLLAGAMAGICVDFCLFPLDTLKTRLQAVSNHKTRLKLTDTSDIATINGHSKQPSFSQSGYTRIKSMYSGLRAAMLGSAPSAALFYLGYEAGKDLAMNIPNWNNTILKEKPKQKPEEKQKETPRQVLLPNSLHKEDIHCTSSNYQSDHRVIGSAGIMLASAIGEALACLVRVPTDVIKQRMQAATVKVDSLESTSRTIGPNDASLRKLSYSTDIAKNHYKHKEYKPSKARQIVSFFSRCYAITLMRDIPFSCLQFLIYEKLKANHKARHNNNHRSIHTESDKNVETLNNSQRMMYVG